MTSKTPIHVARAGTVAATVYRHGARGAGYCVMVGKEVDGPAEFTLEELCLVRHAVEQAEYFIRYQEQLVRIAGCPGCGDG